MKAIIVPLFTATLSVVVCSAFPLDEKITKGQQTNNLCATLEYLQPEPTGYVRLCYTAGVGNTYLLLLSYLYARMYLTPSVWSLVRFTSRMKQANNLCWLPPSSPFSTTIAGTCITANLPTCRSSIMQNAAKVNVTLYDGPHEVLFSTTSSSEG